MKAPVPSSSIALAWVLRDEPSVSADAALERVVEVGGVDPALWRVEVRNVLVTPNPQRSPQITPPTD